MIFLISSNEQRQLSTIRSRSQIIRFSGLSIDEIVKLLIREEDGIAPAVAREAASIANGSFVTAKLLLDETMVSLRSELIRELDKRPMPFTHIAKSLTSNLQSLGDETQAKRDRLRMIFDFAANHFRSQLVAQLGYEDQPPTETLNRPMLSTGSLTAALKHCLEAQADTDRNATPAGLLEAWAAELASILSA
jgi:DNA polymerase-3 subunit delta'